MARWGQPWLSSAPPRVPRNRLRLRPDRDRGCGRRLAAGCWLLVERYRDGKPTTLGVASGAVAGLVAITPACAFIAPWAAILLGLAAGGLCCFAIGLKHKLGFDDALDVVGVHLVGGAFGAISLGFLAAYKTMGFRVSEEDEITGVDLTQHAETAYDFLITQLGHTSSPAVTSVEEEEAIRDSEPVTGTGAR